MTRAHAAAGTDRMRQLAVTVGLVACFGGALAGLGVGGDSITAADDGAMAVGGSLLTPAGPAFAIWGIVYAGLAAFTVRQWLPAETAEPRQRAIGWLAAAAMALDGAWPLVVRLGWTPMSVVVMVALVVALGQIITRLEEHRSFGVWESAIVDGTFGTHLGWVAIAAVANLGIAVKGAGADVAAPVADAAAAGVVALSAVGGIVLVRRLGGRWAVGSSIAWGLAWIGWGRLAGEPQRLGLGVLALVAASAVLVATARWHSSLATID